MQNSYESEQKYKSFKQFLGIKFLTLFIMKNDFEILARVFSANCVKIRFWSKRISSILMFEMGLSFDIFLFRLNKELESS